MANIRSPSGDSLLQKSQGNLAWRMICEFWIVLFNIHARLASIDLGVNQPGVQYQTKPEVGRRETRQVKVQTETKSETDQPEQGHNAASRPTSVLGLSS